MAAADLCKGGCGRPHAPSDEWCYQCALEGKPNPGLSNPDPPRTFVVVKAQSIVCLWCGRPITHGPVGQPIWMDLSDGKPARMPLGLLCHICGGPAIAGDEVTSRRVYTEKVSVVDIRPRRGRPPNALVALRKTASGQAS